MERWVARRHRENGDRTAVDGRQLSGELDGAPRRRRVVDGDEDGVRHLFAWRAPATDQHGDGSVFENDRRTVTCAEYEQVVTLAGVMQRAVAVTRQPRSRHHCDGAPRFGEQHGLLVRGDAVDASIDATEHGADMAAGSAGRWTRSAGSA